VLRQSENGDEVKREGTDIMKREAVNFWACTAEIMNRICPGGGGVLCTVLDKAGNYNVLTLGWGLVGSSYHGNPVYSIAVAPKNYSWQFLEEVPEFVIAVPNNGLERAVELCGTKSGRGLDKFKAANLTSVPSVQVRPPSIAECTINVECRIYAKVAPPHMLLSPEHRKAPVEKQHTIYFAEVLGTYRY